MDASRIIRRPGFSIPTLIAAFVAGAFGAWLLCWNPFSAPPTPSDICLLEIEAASPTEAILKVDINDGHGYSLPDEVSTYRRFPRGDTPQLAPVCPLPPGQICALRVSLYQTPEFALRSAQIRMRSGKVLASFKSSDLDEVTHAVVNKGGTLMDLHPDYKQGEVTFVLPLSKPLQVPNGDEPSLIKVAAQILILGALCLLLKASWPRWSHSRFAQACTRQWRELLSIARARPNLAIFAVSVLAVVLNCFPIVFCGKSLVSPNTLVGLLYDAWPTLPDTPKEMNEEVEGTDVAAVMWAHYPYSVVESRAIWNDHEIPLWNRFNSAGVCLLGQGQSMLGDPLHWIPLLAGAQAWAWDLKFILAKILFAFGIGLCVRTITRGISIPALAAASSVWVGFFCYRYNHPAVFSFCYSPWILLGWLRINEAAAWRAVCGWSGILMLAEMAELNSGTAKESSMLLLGMNFTGVLVVLFSNRHWREKALRLLAGGWANLLFLLVSAPFWLLFVDALRQGQNIYEHPEPIQMPPGFLLAYFDGLFSQDASLLETHNNPSANLFILIGIGWFFASRRSFQEREERAGWAIVAASLVPLALVFGIVPADWIKSLPLLSNIEHIQNTFGCLFIVQFAVLAGIGLRRCAFDSNPERWSTAWRFMLIFFGLALAGYLGWTQSVTQQKLLFITRAKHSQSYFFTHYLIATSLALLLVPWALRWVRMERKRYEGVICLLVCFFVLHFRHGMYLETKFDHYVMNPRTGANLMARSAAVEHVRQQQLREPSRVGGLGANLMAGYQGVIGLEGISGPDALMNKWYREFYLATNIHLMGSWMLRIENETFAQFKPLYDFLNVGYYLRMPGQGPSLQGYLTQLGQADMAVFQSRQAWPRAFFTDKTIRYDSAATLVKLITEGDGKPFAAIQEEGAAPDSSARLDRQIVPARDYHLTNNATAFTVSAPGPGVIVLGEAYEPGNFRLTVNGKPADYFRVNHAFKGIRVDRAGEYQISFTYWPARLTPALWICACGLGLIGVTLLVTLRGKHLPAWGAERAPGERPADKAGPDREQAPADLEEAPVAVAGDGGGSHAETRKRGGEENGSRDAREGVVGSTNGYE